MAQTYDGGDISATANVHQSEDNSSKVLKENVALGISHTDGEGEQINGNVHQSNGHENNQSDLQNSKVFEEIEIGKKAGELKEHDVLNEEIAEAEKLEAEEKKELDDNDGWMKILGNDQIMKKILKNGIPNKKPLRGEVCTIKLEGRLKSDENVVFESLDDYTFQLGDSEVVSGLDLAIPLMCKGEVSTVTVAHRFGYGSKGLVPNVPPNSDLVYTVEVLDFEPEKELEELSVCERRDIGNRKRERGNWWYGRGEASLAIQCYRRALDFLDDTEGGIQYPKGDDSEAKVKVTEDVRLMIDDRLKTFNNMAAAQLKLKAYQPALNSVESVLACQPKNVKALYRKGKILGERGDTEAAIEILKRANELEPENKAVLTEISKLGIKHKEERKSEKLLYKRMFKDANKENPAESKSSYKRSFNLALVVGGVIVALAGAMAYRYAT